MDRRTFLGLAVAAVGTSGCTDRSPTPHPDPSTPRPAPDPDTALRQRVAESEAALIAAYRAAVASTPELAPTIEPILRQHAAHLDRVAPNWTPPPSAAPSTPPAPLPSGAGETPAADSSAPGSTAGTDAPAPSPPARPAEVLARLAAAESAARDQRIAACDTARDPALARELCLIGASEAQHAAVLADTADGRP